MHRDVVIADDNIVERLEDTHLRLSDCQANTLHQLMDNALPHSRLKPKMPRRSDCIPYSRRQHLLHHWRHEHTCQVQQTVGHTVFPRQRIPGHVSTHDQIIRQHWRYVTLHDLPPADGGRAPAHRRWNAHVDYNISHLSCGDDTQWASSHSGCGSNHGAGRPLCEPPHPLRTPTHNNGSQICPLHTFIGEYQSRHDVGVQPGPPCLQSRQWCLGQSVHALRGFKHHSTAL
mmetsp:Transcript_42067/g.110813  ORF Transcript_42067/g.110813 Transcript_42067/m.110813 type:complete len:230 (-) Transcript_42067:266-955(-)